MSTNNRSISDVADAQTWTWATDSDGDLIFNQETQRHQLVTDEQAVSQDLHVAVASIKGDDPIDPEFGLDIFQATGTDGELRHEIGRTLRHDDYRHDRVSSINNIAISRDFAGQRHGIDVSVDLSLANYRDQQIGLAVQNRGGSQ